MNNSTNQKPQEIDYQHLAKLWGNEVSQISLPVRDIIAGVLGKVREQNNTANPHRVSNAANLNTF